MRRRKWWFIGLGISLLVAFASVWKWSERSPYKFLSGASLYFVEVDKRATIQYASEHSASELLAEARLELADHWNLGNTGDAIAWVTRTSDGTVVIYELGEKVKSILTGSYPPLDSGIRTMVSIVRTPRVLDRFRSWLYGLRWKGSTP